MAEMPLSRIQQDNFPRSTEHFWKPFRMRLGGAFFLPFTVWRTTRLGELHPEVMKQLTYLGYGLPAVKVHTEVV